MLILKRIPDNQQNDKSEILIGDNILIKVLEPDPDGQTRIGIQAPPEIIVNRKELVDANNT